MKLQIDNLDGLGPRDYTTVIDAANTPRVTRKLNQPSELQFSLLLGPDFVAPHRGSRVLLGRTNGQDVFTGYVISDPEYEALGWGMQGPLYRLKIIAQSDEVLVDEKPLPARSPFVARSAGDALRQLVNELMPGAFDTSGVQNLDVIPHYIPDPQLTWSKHAAAIALLARAAYRMMNGALILAPLGANAYALNESDPNFFGQALLIEPQNTVVNDATVLGDVEPQAYVRDYFVGDGLTSRFYLSQTPFTKRAQTIFDEEYTSSTLDPTRWSVSDPSHAVSVNAGTLQIAGGNGTDGDTTVTFVEQIELGGAWEVEHGDVVFNAACSGILGGLYLGSVAQANCLAGFQISPAGTVCQIQALVSGAVSGAALTTTAGHHYLLSTRISSQEIFRQQEVFHSAAYPAGSPAGGGQVSADVRLVLELLDIDPTNPATLVAPATVLYDGVITNPPAYCTYALVNSPALQCAIAFTRLVQEINVEVRTALSGANFVTRLVGPLSEGGECDVVSSTTLDFFTQYVPVLNQSIEAHYRSQHGNDPFALTIGRAMARVTNPASIAAEQRGIDNGVHAAVRHLKLPDARTSVDCENAALALVTDGATEGCKGTYQCWSAFLPGGASDIFPGDALNVNVPSRAVDFQAIVNEVVLTVNDLSGDNCKYTISFVHSVTDTLAFEFSAAKISFPINVGSITNAQVGTTTLPSLTDAAVTAVSSTTASIDTGISPLSGGGFEVRWADYGWGLNNNENLAGRFTTQTFTLPRLAKVQNYFLRQYDASTPPKYSRYSAALHIDYPS